MDYKISSLQPPLPKTLMQILNVRAEQTCSAWFPILSRATVVALTLQARSANLGTPQKPAKGLWFLPKKSPMWLQRVSFQG